MATVLWAVSDVFAFVHKFVVYVVYIRFVVILVKSAQTYESTQLALVFAPYEKLNTDQ